MFIDGIRSFAVAGLAAAFLLAGATAVQAQTADEWRQAKKDCKDGFNDSSAADSCTVTSVDAFSTVRTVNGVPDLSTLTWTCELTVSCTVEQDDGTSETFTISRNIPLSQVDDTTLTTTSSGHTLSFPGASNN